MRTGAPKTRNGDGEMSRFIREKMATAIILRKSDSVFVHRPNDKKITSYAAVDKK